MERYNFLLRTSITFINVKNMYIFYITNDILKSRKSETELFPNTIFYFSLLIRVKEVRGVLGVLQKLIIKG